MQMSLYEHAVRYEYNSLLCHHHVVLTISRHVHWVNASVGIANSIIPALACSHLALYLGALCSFRLCVKNSAEHI